MTTPLLRPTAAAVIGPVVVEPAYDIDYPAQEVYAQGFETSLDGWAMGVGQSIARADPTSGYGFSARTGTYALHGTGTASAPYLWTAKRTVTDLIVGHPYTFAVYSRRSGTAGTNGARIGVTGEGASAYVSTVGAWVAHSFSFIATATSHELAVELDSSSGNVVFWDDVTLTRDAWTEHVPAVTTEVEVTASAGDATLDAGVVPYGVATVDVPLIDVELVELVDPRDDLRVTLTAGDDEAGTSRVFDLSLRSREVDHKSRVIRLELATDEALLMDYAPLAVDTGARAHEASLRGVCDYVLGKIGASLEAGAWDVDMSCYWTARNLILDPGTAATAAGGYSGAACSIDWNDATWSISGDGDSFNLYNPTGTDSYLAVGSATGTKLAGLQEGKTYVLSATGNVKTAFSGSNLAADSADAGGGANLSRVRALVVHTRQGEGAYDIWHSQQVPNVVNSATRVWVAFTVPIGCTEVFLRAYLGNTAGQIRWDGFTLVERGPGTVAEDAVYFDGDTLDTANYVYGWDGEQDGSTSTRTAVVERSPEVYRWTPGVSAWDFLSPLTSVAGLRLYCDESRAWRLIDPGEYGVPGRVTVSTHNATEGVDRIDRSDPNVYCTGVVVIYRWRDADGQQHEEFDTAGTPGRVLEWEYERPYPGPGAAAAILARRTGRGRTQDVTALADWSATPGMEAGITLPGTVSQIGQTASVRWSLTDGLMRVGTRGLTDAVPGSWLAWDPDETWEDVDPDLTWEEA